MSITDELREAINQLRVECEEKEGCGVLWYPEPSRDRFSEIADRINQAHDAAMDEAGKYAEELEHALEDARAGLEQWHDRAVMLPTDAEGVPFRVGDVVELMFNDEVVNRGTIERITFYKDDWVDIGLTFGGSYPPDSLRHAQADTFDTIISDAVNSETPDIDALVKRCERVAARQVGGNEG